MNRDRDGRRPGGRWCSGRWTASWIGFGLLLATSLSAQSWLRATLLEPRRGSAMAYDGARDRVVLFGGYGSLGTFGDTWEWDGASWFERPSPVSPGRQLGALAYDTAGRRVVFFSEYSSETWEWDGAQWVKRIPAARPGPRMAHALAYDPLRQRVVLFGGMDLSYRDLADTWEWDGVSWTQRQPASSPVARAGHAMAYDAARQRVVLFGGRAGATTLADTWEWDGASWSQRTPAANPPARVGHAMAYDTVRRRLVVFGGSGAGVPYLSDTWEWDGASWVQQRPTVAPPAAQYYAMAYEAARQRIVVFGAGQIPGPGETWEWDGASWVATSLAAGPAARPVTAMAYDTARRRVVLFGGGGWSYWLADTWLYGGLVPAAAQAIGTACAGSGGPPVLASNAPFLGHGAFKLDLLAARALAPCVLALAANTQSLALGGGCTLYLKDAIAPLATTANASGFATIQVSIPLDVSLRGVVAYAQGFVIDPMGPFAGLAASGGLRLTLGD